MNDWWFPLVISPFVFLLCLSKYCPLCWLDRRIFGVEYDK